MQRQAEFLFKELENIFEKKNRQEGVGVNGRKSKKNAEHYNYDAQSRQCIEEMAELTKALNKFWRKNLLCGQIKLTPELLEKLKKTPEYKNILEEVADVQIMILQIIHLLSMDISKMVDFKVKRQIERIETDVETESIG